MREASSNFSSTRDFYARNLQVAILQLISYIVFLLILVYEKFIYGYYDFIFN